MLSSTDNQEQQGLFIAALETALGEVTSASFLLVGATGGVRAAVASGKVTTSILTRFREALSSTFDSRFPTQFECISGEDEGKWELSAAQTIWGADTSAMFGIDGAFVGLLSGGGTTMQIGSA